MDNDELTKTIVNDITSDPDFQPRSMHEPVHVEHAVNCSFQCPEGWSSEFGTLKAAAPKL